jgi:hypothetical protein
MEKLRAMRDEVNNSPRKYLTLFLPFLLWPILAFADEPFSINGYYKNFFVVFNPPKYKTAAALPDQPSIGAVNNRLRIKLFYNFNTWLSLHAAHDFSPRIQDPLLFENQPVLISVDPFKYRAIDFDARLYPAQNKNVASFGIFHNLDRALVTVKTAPADMMIGRQAIAWGSARVLNPTDILAPFSFEELDTEERIGVDAVRARVPLSALAEFDAGYVFGKDFQFEQSAFFTRAKFYAMETDVALLLLGFREHLLAGIDIARSIGGAGFWLEAAYTFAEFLNDAATGKANDYFRGTIGLDYALSGKTYGFIEYHFSEAGAGAPENYLKNTAHPAFADGAVYLLGKHYLAPGLTHQITPLISFGGQALFNLADRSLFVSPTVEYNIAQNIYVSAGAFFGIGKRPEIALDGPLSPVLKFRSEFGGYPDIYFSSFRIYF